MALTGIKFRANPTPEQKQTLSQWMGCARFIWNAKCEENAYFYKFKQKFVPISVFTPIDQSYSQFKNPELSPWLNDCPSQILRNTMCTWRETMSSCLRGECKAPRKKKKRDGGSIWLTSELFRFDAGPDGKTRLFVGSKTNNIGYLDIKIHREFSIPRSLRIKQKNGDYTVSFCYEDGRAEHDMMTQEDNLRYLSVMNAQELDKITIGVDRGVVIPVQAGDNKYDFSDEQKQHKKQATISIKKLQKKLNRQAKGSKQRNKTKQRISKKHQKIARIRNDFAHQTSHRIVSDEDTKIIIFEDLKAKHLTKTPRAKTDESGKYVKNGAAAKAGLNRVILDKGWGYVENFCEYKAKRAGKAFFKIVAHQTSQECANCGYTHPDNRQTQSEFACISCGHTDNADHNAAMVIKKRAIKLIIDSGTELSKRGVLLACGHRARSLRKTGKAKIFPAMGCEASKMIDQVAIAA